MSGGNRLRPWQRQTRRVVEHAVTDTVLHGVGEGIGRAAAAAAQDRSLDIVRGVHGATLDWYNPKPWYQTPLHGPRIPEVPTTGLRHGSSHIFSRMRSKAYGLRAFANPLTRGLGKALRFTVKGVPVVGTALELFHPSPLADGTLTAAGRQMMNRWRTGRDPFKGYVNMTPHDKRRATAFMIAGYNPLRPGRSPQGLTPVYAGDLKPHQGVKPHQEMVFDPDPVYRSPQIVPAGPRNRPWTAAPGGAFAPYAHGL